MIAHLQGELTLKRESYIIIDIQGVGYKVNIPLSLQMELPDLGEEVKVYTYTYVREDKLRLYGFLKMSDLELFEELLGVSKIGPKGAINTLSTLSAKEFKLAVAKEEIETLKRVKGIGKKTAQRLILEMKGKIDLEKVLAEGDDDSSVIINPEKEEAVEGLLSLGYSRSEARKAVEMACKEEEITNVEEIIRLSLQNLG
ncbi:MULTISPECIES: Holliday junction branch migration protein RuvA [unclassified Candidatus Frackibacter]|uniref:Holliday junction branch migration protein RuvA n=1 Tax=unclassified Candidatus Frackibacter TaxID=2648818 RepID=UPI0007933CA1|nr:MULTISPECIES: Holliday junction branch migration protein RuvA [unclassified Candidatus Frackibacter]KXS40056.1 MAG: holliday junction DNA helicase RuvA [Candidatus Frackibacter sp. T328-2]SDC63991.1 Holliday junction DNA helicase subunit RuvA [Candidatus Frackibacter sp. WG11]SEM77846.1 Holliday junction DNA helicase subunit RuvA [Candidatus Frackibacter sp. WG12]SFL88255.1 Holliday junction DNA helicase subunit RuvA [Candidatus Frackibacter sp. WG13]